MQLSIIIPVFYGEEIFEKCLATLYPGVESKLNKEWEILVLNNGFNPSRWQELAEIYPKIKFYGDGAENLGFAKGNNVLLKKTKGDYVLLLNQDVFIKPKVIETLIKFLENNPEYTCVAPQLRYGNNTIQESCRRFPKGIGFLLADLFLGGKKYRHSYSLDKSQEVDQPLASCLLWRGKPLRDLKGFDVHPHFFLYFNDVDLSYRLNQMGGKTYFLASSYATHLHGGSATLLPENERILHLYKGLGRFWYKTGSSYFVAYFKAFLGACIIGLGKILG
jgi:GT2 family glycosyltransferase